MELAVFIGFGAVAAALMMWVYFDAMELGKPAVGWAVAQPLLGWILFAPLILYVIFREHGPRRVIPEGGAQRQVTYVFSFVGFGMAAFAVSLLIAMSLVSLVGDVDSQDYRKTVASSLAMIVLGLLLWAVIWFPAVSRLPSIMEDDRFRASFYLHRGYIYTLIALSAIVAFITGLWLLAGLLSEAFGVGDVATEDWIWTLGPLLVSFAVIALHFGGYVRTPAHQAMQSRFDSIPPPPFVGAVPPPVTTEAVAPSAAQPAAAHGGSAHFCSQCGGSLVEGQRFCPNCGAAVSG